MSDSGRLSVGSPAPRCHTCNGSGISGAPFDTNCPAAWAHRFVRPFSNGAPTAGGETAAVNSSANYVHVGRWSQCAWCGGVCAGDHWCGAPWQVKASDVPEEWTPGNSPLFVHYPQSPFAALLARQRDGEREALLAERDAMRHTFAWLLGEEGEFPNPPEHLLNVVAAGKKAMGRSEPVRIYWWRRDLRERWADAIRVGPDNPNSKAVSAPSAEKASE